MRIFQPTLLSFAATIILFYISPVATASYSGSRQLLYVRDDPITIPPYFVFENVRLERAYVALQAWKRTMISDPWNLTLNWFGPRVCDYNGVVCSESLDDPSINKTVSGVDLNHGDIAGHLPEELGLLTDIALFHVNSNRFCGTLPLGFSQLSLLFELDLSNNRFAGKFPELVIGLPKLKYLDLRYNEFEGGLPESLFEKDLDALFLNSNRFTSKIPVNMGSSPVSVLVLASNRFDGCIPTSFSKMGKTLNEIILMDNGLQSCLPNDMGLLQNVTVLDISYNSLVGELPESMGQMESLEVLNVERNMFSGVIPEEICLLKNLREFIYGSNYFTGEPPTCRYLETYNSTMNCLKDVKVQRSTTECKVFLSKPVDCDSYKCSPVTSSCVCPGHLSPPPPQISPFSPPSAPSLPPAPQPSPSA
ncbi:leucine-rich repeat extensin-like protein 7 [Brassica napus]|uniref:leucine-rich repeat extensin-like protein 7 n=1 Tax=Brassica napus TaxID=3708 RepID=UPI0020785F40|nr:leucine-rich repeat extensin-like protein 7 [Brassica napus]